MTDGQTHAIPVFILLGRPVEVVKALDCGLAADGQRTLCAIEARNEYAIKNRDDVFFTKAAALRAAIERLDFAKRRMQEALSAITIDDPCELDTQRMERLDPERPFRGAKR